MPWYKRIPTLGYVAIAGGIFALHIIVLHYQGHIFICACNTVRLWYGAVNSPEDSQQLSDWYTFSHIIHGFIFYWFLRKITGKKWPIPLYLVCAMGIEVGWEMLENSPLIINRYRETASLMYFGDSIINSMSDVVSMMFGFLLAWKLPVRVSLFIIIFLELFTLYWIKDNLTLNVIMLAYPFEGIRHWQLGS